MEPFIVVDNSGMIIMWQLQSILWEDRQMALFSAMRILNTQLKGSLKSSMSGHGCNWRADTAYFKSAEDCCQVSPGVLNFSPAWFHQAHEICIMESGVEKWLWETLKTTAILNSIICVIHPGMFRYGTLGCNRLRELDGHRDPSQSWLSIYTSMAVIANREMPIHQDHHCYIGWYDFLATVGPYSNTEMEMASLGFKSSYLPGTVSALSSHVVSHGISACAGERVCYAYLMWHKVPHRVGFSMLMGLSMMADHYQDTRAETISADGDSAWRLYTQIV
ncbi:hypothetical protein JAAARDRAFT_138761 [Jaapia argillacea MUCL 33604]|uniref:Uncharacterized protein n=1 Tax=Jaapia argillacea MUCL 33604 TaxID=933084 RepID=A0A067PPY8_9AGAM|nr:hypothetical protein JAAARDRAFT_138761 [Jaapia argillacea MUCL 33604]